MPDAELVLTLTLKFKHLKRVLIITYYWPPAGGVAVQRWVKMARYLRQYGWDPVIYTAENGEVAVEDHSLAATLPADLEVLKQPIWEPYAYYRKLLGLSKQEKINAAFLQEKKRSGFLQKVAIWIRGNFFIPDARVYWVKPSVKYLQQYLQQHPVDAIISTGPPHSMHLIAQQVSKAMHIPWIADFRDPWTKIDYYHELHLMPFADRKHHSLEKSVVTQADAVVTVSKHWAADFNALNNGKTHVITNGFDRDDYPTQPVALDEGFVLHHVGMINKARNPELLWQVIAALCKEDAAFAADVKLKFTGKHDHSLEDYLRTYNLLDKATFCGQVDHATAIQHMCSATVLLLLVNDAQDILGRIPAKLFEYLAAQRPVLSVGDPDGDAADILRSTEAGVTVRMNDAEAIRAALLKMYQQWKSGNLKVVPAQINAYERSATAQQFADLLQSIQRKASSI